ncbi:hypothetical protein ACQEPB_02075 [Novosphingobium fluoreni]|uniref:hypothetical protein n=1 Tax=Novosphingobium fluoreni TaxID=1391222 RepID=UPI003DA135B4
MFRRAAHAAWSSATLMTWGSLLIRMGGLALLLPLVLTRLDTKQVLVWQMLSTITMMVNWTDFGFSPTFSRIIAFARGGGTLRDLYAARPGKANWPVSDEEATRPLDLSAVLGTQRSIYRRLIVCAMVVALVFGTGALWKPVRELAQPSDGWLAWAFTAGAALLTLANGANVSVLTGFDRIATARRVEAACGVLQLSSTSIVTLTGGGLVAIVACYSFWLIPMALANRHNVAQLGLDLSEAARRGLDRSIFHVVWPAAWRSGIGILMSTGIIQASGLIYAQIAQAQAAAAYLLALRLFTAISQISQAPFYSRLPAMAHARGKQNFTEVASLAKRGMAMAHWTFVAGALTMTIVAPWALQLIGSSVHWPPYSLAALLGLAFFAERYGGMHMQLYSLTNHIIWHLVNGATGMTMIIAFAALWPFLGATALPLAMLIGYLGVCTWYASSRALASLNLHRWSFEKATAFWPGCVLIVGLMVYPSA